MYQYYAAPIRRELRTLYVNPLSSDCVLAQTPWDACLRLGLPEHGEMFFAVWALASDLDISLEKAAEICSPLPPTRAFVALGDGVIFPLAVDPALDIYRETESAGSN